MDIQQLPLIDPEELRQIMRLWATGVTIVTAGKAGFSHGMTVSSFTSVSLNPPLVLVILQREVRTHSLIIPSNVFGVSVLSVEQRALSEIFAQRDVPDLEQIENLVLFSLKTGTPLLRGALVNLDCKVISLYGAGTHTIILGEVVDFYFGDPQKPLIYFDRFYSTIDEAFVEGE